MWSTSPKETESSMPYSDLQSNSVPCLVLTKTSHHLLQNGKNYFIRVL